MSLKGNPITGYKYSMGILMGICRGTIDSCTRICVGGLSKTAAWANFAPNVTVNPFYFGPDLADGGGGVQANPPNYRDTSQDSIDGPDLFGGDTSEGGIVGTINFHFGYATQVISDFVKNMIGGRVPDMRGVTTVFYNGTVSSNNPYPKAWSFRCQRTTHGWNNNEPWYPEKAIIWQEGWDWQQDQYDPAFNTWFQGPIKSMNGAHILYQCATDPVWGRGLDPSLIDDASFRFAADYMYNEGVGLCLRYTRTGPLRDFCGTVIDHIAAAMYISRLTGLLTLKLIRNDYDLSGVTIFDYTSGLLEIQEDQSNTRDTSFNEVIVNFQSPLMNDQRSVRAHDLGSIQSFGKVFSTTKSYPGCPAESLAGRIAQRDLLAQASGIRRFKVTLDRRGYAIEIGDVFAIRAPDRGVDFMVMRAGKVQLGPLADGKVTIDCVQDVFSFPATSFTDYEPPGWTPPIMLPIAIGPRSVGDASYRDVFLAQGATAAEALPLTASILATYAVKPQSVTLKYKIDVSTDGSNFLVTGRGDFGASGTLDADIAELDETLTIDNASNLQLIQGDVLGNPGGDPIIIDDEILCVKTIDQATGICGVVRGCFDTLPAKHTAGAAIMCMTGAGGSDNVEYASGETLDVKLLPQTGSATLDPINAGTDVVVFRARQALPYPPGKAQINGRSVYSAPVSGPAVDMLVSWAHRDRISQENVPVDQLSGDVGPEAGTTYNLRFYNGATLLRTVTGLTGNSYTYTAAMSVADGAPDPLTVELESERDSLVSWQTYHFTVLRFTGYGVGYGEDYSGGSDTGFGKNFGHVFGG